METVWFDDPSQLVRSDKVSKFWPTGNQTVSERVNATSRFIIYASCILYIINRDSRIILLGGVLLAILYVMWISNMVPNDFLVVRGSSRSSCRDPTYDNPMGNPLIGDDGDAPGPCWYPSVQSKVNEYQLLPDNSARRNFYSIPMNDLEPLKEALNPGLYEPNCRDGGLCTDFRQPEWVHMRTLQAHH